MTKQEISTLALKILSLFFIFKVVDRSSDFIYFIYNYSSLSQSEIVNFLMAIVPAVFYSIFGALLWFISKPMAISIFKEESNSSVMEFSVENVQLVSFTIAGFFLLANTLPQLAELLVYNFQILHYDGTAPFKTLIVLSIIKISIGLWLLLGSRGILNFVNTMRGLDNKHQTQ